MTRRAVAVIGSGFGGAVMACRLAESGRYDVTVFERGPRYTRGTFPRTPEQLGQLFWDPDDGQWGLFEYRSFPLRPFPLRRGRRSRIDVLTSSGYGGGSLIYSNVLYRMPERFFDDWPGGIRRPGFDRWYERVERVFEVQPYPITEAWAYRTAPKSRALAEAAAKMRADPRGGPPVTLEWPNLAVRFGAQRGAELTNLHGVRQATCTMCGECNIGCNAGAKNSLDTNYLSRAERSGAVARPWTAVRAIRRGAKGRWILHLADPRGGGEESLEFDRVIVSAGSLGSTFLLLGLRDHLGLASPGMGTRWSPNGDLLGFVTGAAFARHPTVGPVITGALHVDAGSYPDGFPAGAWIEDGGMPGLLVWYLLGKQSGWWPGFFGLGRVLKVAGGWFGARGGEANIGDSLTRIILRDPAFMTRTMMMLGMGRDRSTGTFSLRTGGDDVTWDRLRLAWKSGDGELHYQRLRTAMSRVADALGGRYVENPLSLLNRYVSVHPLGGLPIADRIEDGPVDARTGRVFGCDGLYVVDGSIVPTAVGPNPSLTIAALAEMYAERMLQEAAA